ncbi:MAG: PAS domain-containing sensor histidine kinase [Devosiaceae bacterium]|nr:PAS domain-containing sensor histidine kinase [Devosiaceae bacterium]
MSKSQLRPAWLWDSEGVELIWRNAAAKVFLASEKNSKLKLTKQPVPIAGQVRRLLRLGSPGLTSLSRVRFLAGGKPLSITCSCTPILLENNQSALMIVGVDPVKQKHIKKLAQQNPRQDPQSPLTPFEADEGKGKRGADDEQNGDENAPNPAKGGGSLSKLIDRLNNGNRLYEPLNDSEEIDPNLLAHANSKRTHNEQNPQDVSQRDGAPGDINQKDIAHEENIEKPPELWRLTGRGFVPENETGQNNKNSDREETDQLEFTQSQTSAIDEKPAGGTLFTTNDPAITNDPEMERVARYNFKKLGHILEKRVGVKSSPDKNSSAYTKTITLSDEMLVLNRLPIGILIFKDQNILFANRALADLVGSSSISELKANGLAAIFPRVENPDSSLGPILAIMGEHGAEVKVNARLQGINWHGSQALMLSAQASPDLIEDNNSLEELKTSDNLESSKFFIRSIASARNEGFIEINRNGIISNISQRGAEFLERSHEEIIGKPFSSFIDFEKRGLFREFLEQKAKTAETELPRIELSSKEQNLEFEIFAGGRAGYNNGYFGTFKRVEVAQPETANFKPQSQSATLLLNRLSQGIRRPLNTILGFSELIGTEAFGKISNPRYVEYARDIETAGNEISRLSDELDEYTLLENQGVAKSETDFDLKELLSECLALIRPQAKEHRVILRDAIAHNLPDIVADRASLRQAVLNLLASAISQTPVGSKVILSAQIEDDGSLGIHVRDSSIGPKGIDERFVIFKERGKRNGDTMVAMKSTIGLALTRSLISVNSCALHVDPSAGEGTLMSLVVPSDLVVR